MSNKTRDAIISVILFALVLIVAAMFVKYFGAFLMALGLTKSAAMSIAKLIVAIAMFIGSTILKEKMEDAKVKKAFDSSVFQEKMRRSMSARRGYHGF